VSVGESPLHARAGMALLRTNLRYWSTVAPVVRGELKRWRARAETITDAHLRGLALRRLDGERLNAEAGAMLATLAPRPHRARAVKAIVALELLFDYLDALTEQPSADPLREGERLFSAYTGAVDQAPQGAQDHDGRRARADGDYLNELSGAVRVALAQLPARAAVAHAARAVAARSAEAQIRMHATPRLGSTQLEQWARSAATQTPFGWRETLAGAASSVLALHALIAAAADPQTTPEQAGDIDAAYLSICVVLTLLDGLVDHVEDSNSEHSSYIGLYRDREELASAMSEACERAARQTQALPDASTHLIMLVGVVAYQTTAPGARSELAQPIAARLQTELRPLITPTLWVMRTWRLARRLQARPHGTAAQAEERG
jgi:tetraprenyl-beta-curcumene synthase